MRLNLTERLLTLLVFAGVVSNVYSQNLETIGKEKPLKISGGASLSQIFYTASGIDSRRDPYTYYGSGNINFNFYGWNVPFSFSFSNQNTSFQQPFNRYSIHPTYKWITGHFGYTSMSFSPYTVSGHTFLGAGVDLAPEGKFKFSALYGRFLKAVQPDSVSENAAPPSFDRFGYGFKASYVNEGDMLDFIVFRAKDDVNSIIYVPEDEGILPEENLVMSLGGTKQLFDHFAVKAEFATSAITRDVRATEADHSNLLSKFGSLFTSRTSSSYYSAFKSSLAYLATGYTLGVGYERVAPGYRTLGAYYFNNDLENITVNGATAILQGKVNVAVSAGTQRDNLDGTKISTMRRFVGSANVGYVPSQKLNLSLAYSSFQTYTNIRSQFVDVNQLTPYDNLDTLNFTQISQNATLTALYMFGASESKRQTLNANFMIQDAADRQGDVSQNSGTRFYNMNTAYSLSLVPQNMVFSLSFNVSVNDSPMIRSSTLGPIASVTRSFFDKKLRASLSLARNQSYSNGDILNIVTNARANGSLTVQKKHNLNLSLVMVNRQKKVEGGAASFTEFTGTVGYAYSFGQ